MKLKSFLSYFSSREKGLAVSILLPTHRTFPDNKQDAIMLKNLVTEARNRLQSWPDRQEAETIMEAIDKKISTHDHNYNLDGLGIFANREGVTLINFPFTVKEQMIVDEAFAIRDLIREINGAVHYRVLVISRTDARLIEGFNSHLVHEFDARTELRTGSFPMENPFLFAAKGLDRAQIPNEAANLKEFFNRVDKSLQEIQNKPEQERLPVIIAGDARNAAFFREVCDQPADIIGEVTSIPDLRIPAEKIIVEVQGLVSDHRRQKAETALQYIAQARNNHQLLTDSSMIFRAIDAGNAARLFVRQGYIQPGIIDFDQKIVTLQEDSATVDAAGGTVTDDVVGTLIELVIRQRGEVHFLSTDQLGKEAPLSLQKRY